MTSHNAVAEQIDPPTPPGADAGDLTTVETRFGTLRFQSANLVRMPRGLLGYSNHQTFGLANMPDENLAQFKILQSMDDAALSFIVLPLEPGNGSIEEVDLRTACQMLSLEFADCAVLLVVSTRQVGPATQISVNLRAPIIIDAHNRRAWQYVLPNSAYPVRQVIATAQPKHG